MVDPQDLSVSVEQVPAIVTWAKELDIWGKGAREKEIPSDLFTLNNRQIALLLGRMWDGDGSIAQQPRGSVHAYYATASERMARQIQHLLLRLGIMSSFRSQMFKYKDGRIGYQVHIMGGQHILKGFLRTIKGYGLPGKAGACNYPA